MSVNEIIFAIGAFIVFPAVLFYIEWLENRPDNNRKYEDKETRQYFMEHPEARNQKKHRK